MVMFPSTRLPRRPRQQHSSRPRLLRIEVLEERRLLAARAVEAVNLFASDAYEHIQQEEGNLFFSPLSIATALSMTYAGAAGQTATELEQVFHLGTEPGIHASFDALHSSFETQTNAVEDFELTLANALWPQVGSPLKTDFVDTLETDYRGHAENVDYSNPEQAEDIINAWVADQTNGRIQDLVQDLSPATVMVLTNSVYFKGLWDSPFDPRHTQLRNFHLGNGETIQTPTMYSFLHVARTVLDGFQILDLPMADGNASMVIMLPPQQQSTSHVTPELLTAVDDWFASPHFPGELNLTLPKFQTTVSTELNELLIGMGMPSAFGGGADFSSMTDADVFIRKVFHKAFIEVNEQGTEAAAATEVEFAICFPAGTPVRTPEGEKPIEQLKAGDYVLARDEHNVEGSVKPKLIEETFGGHTELLELHVSSQVIRTTASHPFFVQGKGWTAASDLQAGDRLSTDSHSWVSLDKMVETQTAVPVYNFRVADLHTYFIGSESWEFALWVHNGCVGEIHVDRPFHFLIRDNVTSTIAFMGRVDDPRQLENVITPTVQQVNADFDGDLDIDGADFLAWQQGYGATYQSSDLTAWKETYNQAEASADFDNDLDIDGTDFLAWQQGVGDTFQTSELTAWETAYGQVETPPLSGLLASSDPSSTIQDSPQEPLASENLIDAAMALASSDVDSGNDKPLVVDEESFPQADSSATGESGSLRLTTSEDDHVDLSNAISKEAEADESQWLTDELLERVFR